MKHCIGIFGVALALALACTAVPALAQTGPSVPPKSVVGPRLGAGQSIAALQARRGLLFNAMLARPDDLDAAFEYAALSAQVGDVEAAISTLERMLIFAPGLPRLQLELGVLYYRMAAYETARGYFESAVSGPDVPDEVRARVDAYLGQIDRAGDTTRYSGQIRAGYRYQTNANRAPTDSIILIGGLPFTLTAASLGSPDSNVFGTGVFHASYDLPAQGTSLEVDLIGYASKQFERDELDVALAELTVGPAFDLARFGMDDAALGIYAIVNGVYLGDDFYSVGYGAGTRLVVRPNPSTSLLGAVEYRQKDYRNSPSAPSATLRDGGELRGYVNATYVVSPRVTLSGTAYLQQNWARRGYLEYLEGGIAGGPRVSFDSPLSDTMPDWIFGITGGALFRNYADPDPVLDPFEAERDWEAFAGLGLTVPLSGSVALITEAEYRHVASNYATRNYDNFLISVSLAKGF